MKMAKVLFLLILCLFFQTTFSQTDTASTGDEIREPEPDKNPFRSPFRYVIVAGVSDVDKYVNRNPSSILDLEVLIDDAAFNEKNLRYLFKLLSERFPNSKLLTIDVFTTLDAIKTPEEMDHKYLKGPIENYKEYKYAFFYRRPDKCDSNIYYGVPGNDEVNIQLKCNKNGDIIF